MSDYTPNPAGPRRRSNPVQAPVSQTAQQTQRTRQRLVREAGREGAGVPRGGRPDPSARLSNALARSRAWARPASTGARIGAFSIDAAVTLVIATVVGGLTRSVLLGILVLIEVAVIQLVLEARTGVTLGNLLLWQRTARDDAPFSPGIGRNLVRGLVIGAGSLLALIGGWIVVATSAADPTRMGRSWADRAGRTLVVRVPSDAEREAWSRNAEVWAQSAPVAEAAVPVADARPPQPIAAAPLVPAAPSAPIVPAAPFVPAQPVPLVAPHGGAPAPAPAPSSVPAAAALPAGVVAVDAPIAPAPPKPQIGEMLVLSFDSGQRIRLRIPAAANLGRRPDPIDADDQLVAVADQDGSVSKTHLRLEYRGDSVWVTDLGSTNGSEIVDDTGVGSALAAGARVRLEEGASVRIGMRTFTVGVVTGEL